MMCISKDPLQTKSDMEIDMLDGDVDDKDEAPVDELENIFTAATQACFIILQKFNTYRLKF
jgi:hypothetical protein